VYSLIGSGNFNWRMVSGSTLTDSSILARLAKIRNITRIIPKANKDPKTDASKLRKKFIVEIYKWQR
jgi:hypothetical protein